VSLHNNNLGDGGMACVIDALPNLRLTVLDVGFNNISPPTGSWVLSAVPLTVLANSPTASISVIVYSLFPSSFHHFDSSLQQQLLELTAVHFSLAVGRG
jgi:hypothetical protein